MVVRIGSWRDNNLQMKCAREAVKLIKSYISEGTSFNQETTLSGKSIINNRKAAKEKGFYIVMNYIGVESPEISKDRVRIRINSKQQLPVIVTSPEDVVKTGSFTFYSYIYRRWQT